MHNELFVDFRAVFDTNTSEKNFNSLKTTKMRAFKHILVKIVAKQVYKVQNSALYEPGQLRYHGSKKCNFDPIFQPIPFKKIGDFLVKSINLELHFHPKSSLTIKNDPLHLKIEFKMPLLNFIFTPF